MPFSLTPKDSSFYPLFTASAENLVAATDVLSEFIHDHARRPELAGKLRDLEHAGFHRPLSAKPLRPTRNPPATARLRET